METAVKRSKPIIKLGTTWTTRWHNKKGEPHTVFISHGIWEACAVKKDKKEGRIFTLKCVIPHHANLKVGDTRKMNEETLLYLCNPVTLNIYPTLLSQGETIDAVRELDFKKGTEVVILYKNDDLPDLELGKEKIVLKSTLKKFGSLIDNVFLFVGTLDDGKATSVIKTLDKNNISREFIIPRHCLRRAVRN